MTQQPGNAVPGREPAASEIAYEALIGGQSGPSATTTGATAAGTGTPSGGQQSSPGQATSASERAGAAKQEAQQQAADVAGNAKEQASAVAGTAKEQASAVAGTAKEQASAVAGTAKEQAGNVLGEAKAQAGDLLEDLRRQLAEQSDGIRDRLAEFFTTAGSELSDMASAGGGSGYATNVVRQVGDRASSWGAHLSDHDASDLLEQGRYFARRKPGTFLLGAVLAGVVAGRLTRGAKAHHDETSASTGSATASLGGRHATGPVTEEVLPYSESEAILARTAPSTLPVPEADPFASPDPRP
ncbi:ATP synthase subunit B family protein [Kineococcus sp. SYSU DK001]|uniref:hypothetical protein n=1 Tax=Kineococcus sp. SYSU DK001 TaxID=3383122 RepID=UPI003D7E3D94